MGRNLQLRDLTEYIHAVDVADLPILVDILRLGKYETEVREACLNALYNLGDERVLPVFLEILEDTGDLRVIELVINMRKSGKISAHYLVRFLEDSYKIKITSVRDRVVEELFRMAWDNAVKEDEDEDRDPSEEQNSL
jgi:HEAT repeat protein